jgi:hypothetical protein
MNQHPFPVFDQRRFAQRARHVALGVGIARDIQLAPRAGEEIPRM